MQDQKKYQSNSKAVANNILLSLFANILPSPLAVCQAGNQPAGVWGAACGAVVAIRSASARFVTAPGGSTVEEGVVPAVLGVRAGTKEIERAGPGSGMAPAPAVVTSGG